MNLEMTPLQIFAFIIMIIAGIGLITVFIKIAASYSEKEED